MRVTAKGQVTIPVALREKAGIVPGCEVEFCEEGGRIYLRRLSGPDRGQALVKRMAGKGSVKMSADEILALTRSGG